MFFKAVFYYLWGHFIDVCVPVLPVLRTKPSAAVMGNTPSSVWTPPLCSVACPQVPMVEVVCGVPSHASCHDRPPGYVGGPLAPGWPRSGPGHRGFPAAHRHLHPDGRPARGDHPAHQASEFRRVECCRAVMLSVGKKPRLHHPHTITQPVRHYLMPVLTGVAAVAGWEYFVWVHLPL